RRDARRAPCGLWDGDGVARSGRHADPGARSRAPLHHGSGPGGARRPPPLRIARRPHAAARLRAGRQDAAARAADAAPDLGRGCRDRNAGARSTLSGSRRGGEAMMPIAVVAGQEIRAGLRNRWVLATTGLLAALALSLALLGTAPVGAVDADPLAVVVVSLASLSIFLLPLIAMLLSFDTIVGEQERGTLLLLLAYPLARWQVLVGKFLGHTAILAAATMLGYGAAAAALAMRGSIGADAWAAFAAMVATSILLGAVF